MVLIITIVVMSIITGTVITLSTSNLKVKNLNNLYTDLKSLNDKIAVYYNQYGTLPIQEKFTGAYDFIVDANPNDDPDSYYVIDINKLNNLVLTKLPSGNGNDVYIINTKTHTIYYPEGVYLDNQTYYRLPGEYSEIKEPITAGEIASNPSEHYGGEVTNYITPSGDPNVVWRIFYADENNIYLIASNYIKYDYAPTSENYTLYKNSDYRLAFDNVYQDYTGSASITDGRITKWIQKYLDVAPTSTYQNIRAVAFMLDEPRWSAMYANPSYAEYAIGGPTLEMFVASYNKTHPENPMYCSANSTGYYVSWTEGGTDYSISGLDTSESLYVISDSTDAYAMWLASPSAASSSYMMRVTSSGYVNQYYYYHSTYSSNPGIRPLVCLKSGVQLEKQSNGKYLIK